MMQGARLAAMLPHGGAMVLLDAVVRWDAGMVLCRTRSHLAPGNPLRKAGRIAAVCGVEFGLQAAALHGALLAGGVAQPAGYVARLRDVRCTTAVLPGAGSLLIEAALDHSEAGGMLYRLSVAGVDGRVLVSARASIALPV